MATTVLIVATHRLRIARDGAAMGRLKRYVRLMSPYRRQPCTGKDEGWQKPAVEIRPAPGRARGGGAAQEHSAAEGGIERAPPGLSFQSYGVDRDEHPEGGDARGSRMLRH